MLIYMNISSHVYLHRHCYLYKTRDKFFNFFFVADSLLSHHLTQKFCIMEVNSSSATTAAAADSSSRLSAEHVSDPSKEIDENETSQV